MTASNTPALSISRLRKRYGALEVIRDLHLEVAAGAVHGLVGLNGSGKTTTIECLLGLQRFDGGSIRVLGHSPAQLHLAGGKVVGIFDTPGLHPGLTVRECLEHARLLCAEPVRSSAEVEALLGIQRYRDFRIRHLSLGNKRRAAIAQALLGNPQLMVLDEPFNGLDAEGVDEVLELLVRINREHGATLLLSSHLLPYLERICSHIAILHQGAIALSDAIGKLLTRGATSLRLKTGQEDAAAALIEDTEGVALQHRDPEGYLHVEMTGADPARLNRLLVERGIDVSALVPASTSLRTLFRRITHPEAA